MDRSIAYRVANFLIREYGSKAADHARENLHWMLAHDDDEAAADWRSILQAIVKIQAARLATHSSPERPRPKSVETRSERNFV
jgi:hypothetical protein